MTIGERVFLTGVSDDTIAATVVSDVFGVTVDDNGQRVSWPSVVVCLDEPLAMADDFTWWADGLMELVVWPARLIEVVTRDRA